MTPRPTELDNLVKAQTLHEADRNQDNIERFLERAERLLKDSENNSNSADTIFLSSYEGVIAVCNAALLHYGTRVANTAGHRTTALQLGLQLLGMKSHAPTVTKLHNKRNQATYEDPGQPLPPSSVEFMVSVLKQAIPACRQLAIQPMETATPLMGPQ